MGLRELGQHFVY